MELTVEQIAGLLGGKVRGDGSRRVHTLAKIEEATPGALSFLSNVKYEPFLYTTQATAVLVSETFEPRKPYTAALVHVKDPRLALTVLLEAYNKRKLDARSGVEQPSFMAPTARMGENGFRGAFSYIGEGSVIGSRVKIFPQVYIGNNVRIGDDCVLYPGAKLYDNTVLGNRCILHAGVVIGSDGFGFAPQPDGTYKNVPQVGNVVLEDDVNIGANTVIDCATMGSTIIRSGVKLDNLIQVAHNVEIGRNTVMAAQSGISGSTKVGENCVIAGQVGIVGHLTLANRTSIGAQSGISKSVTKEGTALFGSPAFNYKDNLRSLSVFRNLPDLQKRVEELERKILNLPGTKGQGA
ncbi:MAG: UDP-3-O-(3-hydroxymyristoyl)glucosamine N-acyltransferase [Cytophagales bacterium]|nr:UDP-3-O-(3-hydroxymyristoyl)glucosamine N-acyltransferase [Cytophagales bacterium]